MLPKTERRNLGEGRGYAIVIASDEDPTNFSDIRRAVENAIRESRSDDVKGTLESVILDLKNLLPNQFNQRMCQMLTLIYATLTREGVSLTVIISHTTSENLMSRLTWWNEIRDATYLQDALDQLKYPPMLI